MGGYQKKIFFLLRGKNQPLHLPSSSVRFSCFSTRKKASVNLFPNYHDLSNPSARSNDINREGQEKSEKAGNSAASSPPSPSCWEAAVAMWFSNPGRPAWYLKQGLEMARKNRPQRNQQIAEAHRIHGSTLKEIADRLGIHYTTVSKQWPREREKMIFGRS